MTCLWTSQSKDRDVGEAIQRKKMLCSCVPQYLVFGAEIISVIENIYL